MTAMKRFGLAALLVFGATLFASTSATASWPHVSPTKSDLAATGAEPNASGVAYLSQIVVLYVGIGGMQYQAKLTITCRDLTPGATYWTPAGVFVADRNGSGTVKVTGIFVNAVPVSVVRSDGVTVLAGSVGP